MACNVANPSISGISMSKTTRSTFVESSLVMASRPFDAVVDTSMFGSAPRTSESRRRITTESSTIITRTGGTF
jgi:hypothetical protein